MVEVHKVRKKLQKTKSQKTALKNQKSLVKQGLQRNSLYNHGEAVDEIRSLSAVWNHHGVMYVINPKDRYTLTRDNQAKRVGKLACQRASADCSASVPSKTEHSTKCRRANGGRAKSMPCRRFATDSILTCGEITCQSFGLDRKKQVERLAFFLAPRTGLEPMTRAYRGAVLGVKPWEYRKNSIVACVYCKFTAR